MYFVEKKKINNYIYFVVRDLNTFELVDYFLFSENNYCPIFEDYFFNKIFEQIVENDFIKEKYNSKKMRALLNSYRIDIMNNRKIDYTSSFLFYDLKKSLYEDYVSYYADLIKSKKTYEGIQLVMRELLMLKLDNVVKNDKKLKEFYDFFKTSDKYELNQEILKCLIEKAYEEAKKNASNYNKDKIEYLKKIELAKQKIA